MDPESIVVNDRAAQLGKNVRDYRDELHLSLDEMQKRFEHDKKVDISTYTSFPTQMTFIIDDRVILAVVSMSSRSRTSAHFLIEEGAAAQPFFNHFYSVKVLRR
jgi:hypothetical protein